MPNYEDEVAKLMIAVRDSTDKMREARAVIERQNEAASKWSELVRKAHQLADNAIADLKRRNAEVANAQRVMLEQAVLYENEQLYYSHPDSKNHELCRIANERLNGIYSVMPALFGKSQRECIDLVRSTAAKGKVVQ